ncbi:hypothetical protein INR49_004963 [Caranx melampygus]|nr:hypothetical protein INR49_004963 [Caranx melampygus]
MQSLRAIVPWVLPLRQNRSPTKTEEGTSAIMADVVAEQVADQKAVPDRELNGEAEDREEADPVETAKKKKKRRRRSLRRQVL